MKAFSSHGSRLTSHGFSLVSAIFLMVVLVVLGASIVTLSSVQHLSSAQQAQALRALYAARTGLEWAREQPLGCPAGTLAVGDLGGALTPFQVDISCTQSNHDVGGVMRTYYRVTAVASAGDYGNPDYVSRTIEMKMGPP